LNSDERKINSFLLVDINLLLLLFNTFIIACFQWYLVLLLPCMIHLLLTITGRIPIDLDFVVLQDTVPKKSEYSWLNSLLSNLDIVFILMWYSVEKIINMAKYIHVNIYLYHIVHSTESFRSLCSLKVNLQIFTLYADWNILCNFFLKLVHSCVSAYVSAWALLLSL
jgi:hypothetical protein